MSKHKPTKDAPKRGAAKHIPLELIQSKIASGMSHVIHRMVNKNLQNECLQLLHTDDLAEVEARIYYVLQQIDKDIEKENLEKKSKKKKISMPKDQPCSKISNKAKQKTADGIATTSKQFYNSTTTSKQPINKSK